MQTALSVLVFNVKLPGVSATGLVEKMASYNKRKFPLKKTGTFLEKVTQQNSILPHFLVHSDTEKVCGQF